MTRFRAFLVGAFCAMFCAPWDALCKDTDPRMVVNWSDYPQIVHIKSEVGDGFISTCTGQYVSKNIILTAAHCVLYANDVSAKIIAVTNDNKECLANRVFWVNNYLTASYSYPYDFAAIEIGPECYSSMNYEMRTSDVGDNIVVDNIGFGALTVLSEAEIKQLKARYDSLSDDDKRNADVVQNALSEVLGRSIKDKFDDHKLKIHKSCTGHRQQSDNVFYTDCYDWGGNSGGPIIVHDNKVLVGVMAGSNNNGYGDIGSGSEFESGGPSVVIFDNWLSDIIHSVLPEATEQVVTQNTPNITNSVATNENKQAEAPVTKVPGLEVSDVIAQINKTSDDGKIEFKDLTVENPAPDISVVIDKIAAEKEERQKQLDKVAENKNRTDVDFVHGILENTIEITRLQQLEDEYKKAYENEHSFANRMISGVSMGAMGIGGMKLAEGLSEQSADAAAARDMEAYMATFQCKIGNKGGKTYTGGTKDIELPGANQLTPIYQEYVDLAASVKQRKNDLGMTPGIESQVILDKANMGLYDDEGHGIENGTYASLYRAAMGSEKDNAKLAEQKDSAASKVKGGAIAAGGGALVGVGGNILNNYVDWGGDSSDNNKSSSSSSKSSSNSSKSSSGLDLSGIKDSIGDIDISKVGSMVGGFMSGAK